MASEISLLYDSRILSYSTFRSVGIFREMLTILLQCSVGRIVGSLWAYHKMQKKSKAHWASVQPLNLPLEPKKFRFFGQEVEQLNVCFFQIFWIESFIFDQTSIHTLNLRENSSSSFEIHTPSSGDDLMNFTTATPKSDFQSLGQSSMFKTAQEASDQVN